MRPPSSASMSSTTAARRREWRGATTRCAPASETATKPSVCSRRTDSGVSRPDSRTRRGPSQPAKTSVSSFTESASAHCTSSMTSSSGPTASARSSSRRAPATSCSRSGSPASPIAGSAPRRRRTTGKTSLRGPRSGSVLAKRAARWAWMRRTSPSMMPSAAAKGMRWAGWQVVRTREPGCPQPRRKWLTRCVLPMPEGPSSGSAAAVPVGTSGSAPARVARRTSETGPAPKARRPLISR
jgi:hypothetical protein